MPDHINSAEIGDKPQGEKMVSCAAEIRAEHDRSGSIASF
jgi:hypothetical protein